MMAETAERLFHDLIDGLERNGMDGFIVSVSPEGHGSLLTAMVLPCEIARPPAEPKTEIKAGQVVTIHLPGHPMDGEVGSVQNVGNTGVAWVIVGSETVPVCVANLSLVF